MDEIETEGDRLTALDTNPAIGSVNEQDALAIVVGDSEAKESGRL